MKFKKVNEDSELSNIPVVAEFKVIADESKGSVSQEPEEKEKYVPATYRRQIHDIQYDPSMTVMQKRDALFAMYKKSEHMTADSRHEQAKKNYFN